MGLVPGTRLGVYEMTGLLGAGGMGEVYRARDTRLNRDVAVKILPEAFAADSDRLARFEREAQALAALNHPHIGAIYGFEDGRALILELVEGETLADRIARGPLPVADALTLARQIASALEVAHGHGVIHRDLKPSNIKITPAGAVKVLDFGLAKLAGPAEAGHHDTRGRSAGLQAGLSMSPTLTSPAMQTGIGLLLGTAAYMAPEQARGRVVDKRADVWAFGCVLFEMLSGRRPFDGSDVSEVLAGVIKGEPPWSDLPPNLPASVTSVLRLCLQKDPAQRLRDCGDILLALDGAFDAPVAAPPRSGRRLASVAAGVLAATVVTAAVTWLLARPAAEAPAIVRFEVPPPPSATFGNYLAVSPDGKYAAFIGITREGRPQLWLHDFQAGDSRLLDRAGIISGGSAPFWSPDSRYIGFAAQGAMRKIDIQDSPAEVITTLRGNYAMAAWTAAGDIVYSQDQAGIMRVSTAGGSATQVTKIDTTGTSRHMGVSMLPDGRRFLYSRMSTLPGQSGVYVGSLDTAPDSQSTTRLLLADQVAQYVPSADPARGWILFLRNGALMAQPLATDSLTLRGDPVRIADEVAIIGQVLGNFSPAASALAYRRGAGATGGRPVWVDKTGREQGAVPGGVPDSAEYPRISPDGTRLALVLAGNVWVHHLDGRPPIKLTFDGDGFSPIWTGDGRRILYEAATGLKSVAADGSGTAEAASPNGHIHPHGVSADGTRVLAVLIGATAGTPDIVTYANPTAMPEPVVATASNEGFSGAALSPDQRWLAYVSNVTGTNEVWVRPFGREGAPSRVSPSGGVEPVWSRDGRELHYLQQGELVATPVDTRGEFIFGTPRRLFPSTFVISSQPPSYDVAPDGRFVMLKTGVMAEVPPISVVLNWRALLPAIP